MMELNGTIKLINPEKQINDRFKKRELVITTQEQYPQTIMIEFVQDKTDLLNGYQAGDEVSISINIRGREWTSPQGEVKYFNTIQGWRINKSEQNTGPSPSQGMESVSAPSGDNVVSPSSEQDDDLPF